MKQELRTLWARLGISLHATEVEIDTLLNENAGNKAAVLSKIFSEGRVEIDGDSYVPGAVVEEYNREHGTKYGVDEVDLDTKQLNGKALRIGQDERMRHKERGDAR